MGDLEEYFYAKVLGSLKWRVGDGKDTKFRPYSCLLGISPGHILSSQGEHTGLEVVVDLFHDGGPSRWNVELIRSIFYPQEASTIMTIPLCWLGMRDKMKWC